MPRLYEIPRGSRIRGKVIEVDESESDVVIVFHHLDGMYSYCTLEGRKDGPVHLAACTPLVLLEDGTYVIDSEAV